MFIEGRVYPRQHVINPPDNGEAARDSDFRQVCLFYFNVTVSLFNRPLPLGGHVESRENKKLCVCTASLALNLRLGEARRAKTKFFILLRLNMAAE